MLRINLHDNGQHLRFAPLTLTRPVGNLRVGILTNEERWSLLNPTCLIGYITEPYLQSKFKPVSDAIEINACIIPTPKLVEELMNLENDTLLLQENTWIAKKGSGLKKKTYTGESLICINERWDLFLKNHEILNCDFKIITKKRTSKKLSHSNRLIGPSELLFIEEDAEVEGSIINTNLGPVYIGKKAEVMEGSIVRGPLAMCEHSALKLGTKIYGATTLGPHCKVGGEVNNSVFQAYSNKGHEGFVGNSLIGEWCNLGADTNTSNLKNNYGNVSTYSYETQKEEKTNVQFMGLTMGDHSKCGINTMFNTATVVGVSCNIYGADFPPKLIPSFSWGGGSGFVPFKFDKAVEFANNMMMRRGLELTEEEIKILAFVQSNNY